MKTIVNLIKVQIPLLGVFLLLMIGGYSCIREDEGNCELTLKFRYIYNMQEADGFSRQADWVTVWVFDKEEKLISLYQTAVGALGSDHRCTFSKLPKGDYTFVAIARSTDKKEKYSDFEWPDLQMGDSIECLTARLSRDFQGVNSCPLNALLIGCLKVYVTGSTQSVVLDLLKCTNTIRISLVSMDGGIDWGVNDFEIFIQGKNGWLSYDGSSYQLDSIIYNPYYKDIQLDGTQISWIAEMNTSRLICDLAPRLVVRNHKTLHEIFNINLTELLSLQAIEEHRKEWSPQEYLDRQDEYALTFITNGNTWIQTKIVVNGWVFSLEDIGL